MKYKVAIINKPIQEFDAPDDAVNYAAMWIYIGWEAKQNAVELLKGGRIAEWAYGFNEVQIYPVEG